MIVRNKDKNYDRIVNVENNPMKMKMKNLKRGNLFKTMKIQLTNGIAICSFH